MKMKTQHLLLLLFISIKVNLFQLQNPISERNSFEPKRHTVSEILQQKQYGREIRGIGIVMEVEGTVGKNFLGILHYE